MPDEGKIATHQQIIDWIATAWEKIKVNQDMVVKSFVVTGITPDFIEGQEGMVRSGEVQQEIVESTLDGVEEEAETDE